MIHLYGDEVRHLLVLTIFDNNIRAVLRTKDKIVAMSSWYRYTKDRAENNANVMTAAFNEILRELAEHSANTMWLESGSPIVLAGLTFALLASYEQPKQAIHLR